MEQNFIFPNPFYSHTTAGTYKSDDGYAPTQGGGMLQNKSTIECIL
jgi:hypothetical protein